MKNETSFIHQKPHIIFINFGATNSCNVETSGNKLLSQYKPKLLKKNVLLFPYL